MTVGMAAEMRNGFIAKRSLKLYYFGQIAGCVLLYIGWEDTECLQKFGGSNAEEEEGGNFKMDLRKMSYVGGRQKKLSQDFVH
jgi:hypothetical protein